jgi:DNA-binding MarR family transcriptional regulator
MEQRNTSESLYLMLFQAMLIVKHGFIDLAEKYDLTMIQLYTLMLMEENRPIPMNEISCKLYCDASYVTGIVDKLLSVGYVVRNEKPEDRRVKMIELTKKGVICQQQALKEATELELPGFKNLKAHELETMQTLLKIILEPSAHIKK